MEHVVAEDANKVLRALPASRSYNARGRLDFFVEILFIKSIARRTFSRVERRSAAAARHAVTEIHSGFTKFIKPTCGNTRRNCGLERCSGPERLERAQFDTLIGMQFSNTRPGTDTASIEFIDDTVEYFDYQRVLARIVPNSP